MGSIKLDKTITIPLLVLIMFNSNILAATYYVDPSGNDSDDGSSGSPFATIQKGVDTAQAGETVFVREGIYFERVDISNSGSPGNPITIEGELGAGGIRLVSVDGGTEVNPGSWESQGNGVYAISSFAFEPGVMGVLHNGDYVDIPRCRKSNCDLTITTSASATVETNYLGVTIDWWDGIEAMFVYGDPTANKLYVRFRDGDNPSSKTIRVSQENDQVIGISNQRLIVIKNLKVRLGYVGILVTGSGASNITIDNCEVYATGREKIMIQSGASDVTVKNCTMYENGGWKLGSYRPGAWDDLSRSGTASYLQGVREWIYYGYKVHLSDNGASDRETMGLNVDDAGPVNAHDNTIFNHNVNVRAAANIGDGEFDFHDNTVYQTSSICLYNSYGGRATWHDNLVYDCNIATRIQGLSIDPANRDIFYYNNRFWNPPRTGGVIFHHGQTEETDIDIWFYHNSLAGGKTLMRTSQYKLPGERWVNNIFSPASLLYYGAQDFWQDASALEFFDYNWMGGDHSVYSGDAAWQLPNNIDAESQSIWDNSSMPDFVLPQGHAAENSGIDVSKTFLINGRSYPPLPGMNLGYFSGSAPNMGAMQSQGQDKTAPSAPANLRVNEER